MKYLRMIGKGGVILLSAFVLSACSGSDTTDTDEIEARAAEETATSAAAMRAKEMQQLEKAAAVAGNVFYFEFDSSALTPDAVSKLNAHIALLNKTDRSVRLEGHTDERGTREYNLALGERRANSVRDYMVANGVEMFRIETVSLGEERPVAYGSGESNWSQNRRVELK